MDIKCPHCHEDDTDYHFIWGCQRHTRPDAHPWVKKTQSLRAKALAGMGSEPVKWLRGLLPQSAVDEEIGAYPVEDTPHVVVFGVFASSEPFSPPPGSYAATDGSGGIHSADPRLRRAGWAAIIFGPDHTVLGFIAGGLAGAQTTNRAELQALLAL